MYASKYPYDPAPEIVFTLLVAVGINKNARDDVSSVGGQIEVTGRAGGWGPGMFAMLVGC